MREERSISSANLRTRLDLNKLKMSQDLMLKYGIGKKKEKKKVNLKRVCSYDTSRQPELVNEKVGRKKNRKNYQELVTENQELQKEIKKLKIFIQQREKQKAQKIVHQSRNSTGLKSDKEELLSARKNYKMILQVNLHLEEEVLECRKKIQEKNLLIENQLNKITQLQNKLLICNKNLENNQKTILQQIENIRNNEKKYFFSLIASKEKKIKQLEGNIINSENEEALLAQIELNYNNKIKQQPIETKQPIFFKNDLNYNSQYNLTKKTSLKKNKVTLNQVKYLGLFIAFHLKQNKQLNFIRIQYLEIDQFFPQSQFITIKELQHMLSSYPFQLNNIQQINNLSRYLIEDPNDFVVFYNEDLQLQSKKYQQQHHNQINPQTVDSQVQAVEQRRIKCVEGEAQGSKINQQFIIKYGKYVEQIVQKQYKNEFVKYDDLCKLLIKEQICKQDQLIDYMIYILLKKSESLIKLNIKSLGTFLQQT